MVSATACTKTLTRARRHWERRRGGVRARRTRPAHRRRDRARKKRQQDEYFVKRNLYPNVDFYSGLVYRALGFRRSSSPCCSPCLAPRRLPRALARSLTDPDVKIMRPQQIYRGLAEDVPEHRLAPAVPRRDRMWNVAPSNASRRRLAGETVEMAASPLPRLRRRRAYASRDVGFGEPTRERTPGRGTRAPVLARVLRGGGAGGRHERRRRAHGRHGKVSRKDESNVDVELFDEHF